MKLIKPYFEIWEQSAGLEGVYKQIERVGRVCYKSEDKIIEDSAKPFVDRMIRSGHGAMLEHGTVYLEFHVKDPSEVGEEKYHSQQSELNKLISRYANNKYSIIKVNHYYDTVFITTNYRVLIENNWLKDLKYICEPTVFHEERATVHFVCDRGVSHEFVRHRVMSFAQESTRYCNYSKDKFGNELTFIQPCWLDDERLKLYGPYHTIIRDKSPESIFIANLNNAERDYLDLISLGWKPQEARAILPNSLKTELVVTGFTSDWNHFFDLRARGTTGAPHPQAKELAEPLMEEFVTRKYINN
jgi:thymidylate synthase (FAD)